jgi:hypothetical protein
MIACDLFAALAIADWPKREWTVLAEILLQQYGPQKRREAFVEPLMVEHLSGLGSKNVYRAIRNLKACNVIRDGSHGGIVFVKDYEQWCGDAIEELTGTPCRTKRLRGKELTFASSAKERFGVPKATKKPPKSGAKPDAKSIETSENVGVPLDTVGVQRDTRTNSFGCPTGHLAQGGKVSNGTPTGADLADIGVDASPRESTDYDDPLTRDRRRAPGDLELEKNKTHIHAGEKSRAPNLRDPDDLAEVNEAIRFLGSYPNTEHIAQFLGQMHNTQDIIGIKGWRWIVAAHRVAKRTNVRRLGFEYLTTVAVNATRADLDEIRAEAALIADTSDVDIPAASQLTRKQTPAERRKAESEAIRRAVAAIPDDPEEA